MVKRNINKLLITLILSMVFPLKVSANNFFIKLEYGILLIVTSKDKFDEAVQITSLTIHFSDDVLFQLVTNSFDDPLHTDFLAEELIVFYLQNNTDFTTRIEVGNHNNQIENDFYNPGLWSKNMSEYHLAGSVVQIDNSLISNTHNSLGDFSIPVESGQLLCMFGCGAPFSKQITRTDHHRRIHRIQYQKLRDKCEKQFKCQYCGEKIFNFRFLSKHLNKCLRAKYYSDFLE